jgi:thiamine pyrophosphate-dependent acetolactate synthase large subunit-like protein
MVVHSNLGLSDAIRRHCETGDLNYIGIRHEGAASFAASAFANLTGRHQLSNRTAGCQTRSGAGSGFKLPGGFLL